MGKKIGLIAMALLFTPVLSWAQNNGNGASMAEPGGYQNYSGKNLPPLPGAAPTSAPTPVPVSTPVHYTTWTTNRKPDPWSSFAASGISLPLSNALKGKYNLGFGLSDDIALGYRVSNQFSLWGVLGLTSFSDSLLGFITGTGNYSVIDLSFWAKYRLIPGVFSPFIFAGPGMSININNNFDINNYGSGDDTDGSTNCSEVGFLAEGGGGLELVAGDATLFVQARLTYDFTSPNFASLSLTDSPNIMVPIQAGVQFNY